METHVKLFRNHELVIWVDVFNDDDYRVHNVPLAYEYMSNLVGY